MTDSFKQFHFHSSHTPAPLLDVSLEICRGRSEKNLRKIDVPVFVIGSALDSDLVLGDPQFPECFAYIYVQDASVSLRKMPEGPDLSVNGIVLENTMLHDQDLIRCGPFEFRMVIQILRNPEDSSRSGPSPHAPLAAPKVKNQPASRGLTKAQALLSDIRDYLNQADQPANLFNQKASTQVQEEYSHEYRRSA